MDQLINGIEVIANDAICKTTEFVQYRFPKSKKKRIRNKWKKNRRNYRYQLVDRCYMVSGKMIVTIKTYEKLSKNIPKTNQEGE